MPLTPHQLALLTNPRYPRSARYDPQWIVDHQMGSHCLWLIESLAPAMVFATHAEQAPRPRILDLGCGKALTSIFLAREFAAQVWAADCHIAPTDNLQRITAAGVADRVFPLHAEAHALPFADGFFDAVVGINSFQFFATSDYYLQHYLARLLRPGGQLGIIVPGSYQELPHPVPDYLAPYWQPEFYAWHTPAWWQTHLQRTGLVHVERADTLPDKEGHDIFRRFEQVMHPEGGLLTADAGRHLTFVRVVATKT